MKPIHSAWAGWIAAMAFAAVAQSPIPAFEATALTGKKVSEQALLGQPTVLIVTPSRAAAQETREWAQALRKHIDERKIRVRDVLALDLPFFMSERDALDRAREKIPKRFHDQTWLLGGSSLEKALDIPSSSEDAYVLVLDPQGRVLAKVKGSPTDSRLQEVQSAVEQAKR